MEDLSNVIRSKRQLPTSVFISDRSPPNSKVIRTNSKREVPSFRKSLFSEAHKQHKQNEPSNCSENQSTNEDLLLEHSNIDDSRGNTETMVKVVIVLVAIMQPVIFNQSDRCVRGRTRRIQKSIARVQAHFSSPGS